MNDAIEAEVKALAIREETEPQAGLALFTGEPDEIIERAVKVADALKKVISAKGLVKNIKGREFIEVAGWQTLGTLCGVTTRCEWSSRVEEPAGWAARVSVLRNGVVIGAAEAQCTRDEYSWKQRDEYALRSMAQTRATSKALRSVLGFIAVLAGYADTPAAEMPDEKPAPKPPQETIELRRRQGLASIHALKDKRNIPDEAYREMLVDMFGDECFDAHGNPSSSMLSLPDLQAFYAELRKKFGGK